MVKQLPHVHKTDLKTTRGNCAASPRNNAGHCSALGRGYITWCDTITHHGPLFGPFCCALRSSAVGTSVAGRRNSSASLSFITPPDFLSFFSARSLTASLLHSAFAFMVGLDRGRHLSMAANPDSDQIPTKSGLRKDAFTVGSFQDGPERHLNQIMR